MGYRWIGLDCGYTTHTLPHLTHPILGTFVRKSYKNAFSPVTPAIQFTSAAKHMRVNGTQSPFNMHYSIAKVQMYCGRNRQNCSEFTSVEVAWRWPIWWPLARSGHFRPIRLGVLIVPEVVPYHMRINFLVSALLVGRWIVESVRDPQNSFHSGRPIRMKKCNGHSVCGVVG